MNSAPLRFAFISTMTGDPWGGSEELWSRAAFCLAQRGYKVAVSVNHWKANRPMLEALRRIGVSISERPSATLKSRFGSLIRYPLSTFQLLFSRRIRRYWLASLRPDLVCLSDGAVTGGADWMEDCSFLGLPYVTLAQANSEWFWPTDKEAQRLRALMTRAVSCFFVSEENHRLFEDQIGLRLSNAHVVRNPFNVPWDISLPWPDIGPNGFFRIACVARLDPRYKGQDLLIRVLSDQKWLQRPMKLSLFGKGPNEEGLRRLVAMYGLSDRASFFGYVNDVQAIWRDHHALLLPSRIEGLPLALVEAMLCGRPAIVTNVAGNVEIVEDNVTGFVASAPTVTLLDEAMERAWKRRMEWALIGQHAADCIRQLLPPAPAATFADLIEDLALRVAPKP